MIIIIIIFGGHTANHLFQLDPHQSTSQSLDKTSLALFSPPFRSSLDLSVDDRRESGRWTMGGPDYPHTTDISRSGVARNSLCLKTLCLQEPHLDVDHETHQGVYHVTAPRWIASTKEMDHRRACRMSHLLLTFRDCLACENAKRLGRTLISSFSLISPTSHPHDLSQPGTPPLLPPTALIYAQTYAQNKQDPTIVWKFNKAKQNWLVRNIWSVELVSLRSGCSAIGVSGFRVGGALWSGVGLSYEGL